jgi:acetyl esterase/lipase
VVDIVAEHGAWSRSTSSTGSHRSTSPAGLEDCYAALLWLHAHAAELGVDADRIIVGGGSAGGCLAAGVALLARDRQGPALAGQLLLCPMLDNTNTTVSSLQYDGIGTWQREANLLAWSCLLGEDLAFSPEASGYAAPTHAADAPRPGVHRGRGGGDVPR